MMWHGRGPIFAPRASEPTKRGRTASFDRSSSARTIGQVATRPRWASPARHRTTGSASCGVPGSSPAPSAWASANMSRSRASGSCSTTSWPSSASNSVMPPTRSGRSWPSCTSSAGSHRGGGPVVDAVFADPDHAVRLLIFEEVGLDARSIGSPLAAAAGSFVAFTTGAFIPLSSRTSLAPELRRSRPAC